MNIHEYLKERGFEMTADFRHAEKGDYYVCPVTTEIKKWDRNWESSCSYSILKKLPQTYEFDGQTFEVPEGYVFERVGLLGASDVGKYILRAPESIYSPQKITEESLSWLNCICVIFRKEN